MGAGLGRTTHSGPKASPTSSAGMFCGHRKQGRAATVALSTLAVLLVALPGFHCTRRVREPTVTVLVRTEESCAMDSASLGQRSADQERYRPSRTGHGPPPTASPRTTFPFQDIRNGSSER